MLDHVCPDEVRLDLQTSVPKEIRPNNIRSFQRPSIPERKVLRMFGIASLSQVGLNPTPDLPLADI